MMTGEREIELILAAATWLAATPKSQRPRAAVVELNERFGLNLQQCCQAIRQRHQVEGAANDNGRTS